MKGLTIMQTFSWRATLATLGLLLTTASGAQPLDLSSALARAAESNPTLKAAYAEVRIAEAGVTSANALENPQLQARVLWPNDTSSPLQEYTLSYNIIDLFSRAGRVRGAELRRQAALANTLARAVDLEAEVKSAFYTLQGHAQALEEQKVLLDIAELQEQLAQRQREAGNIPALLLAQYQAHLLQARTQYYDRQMSVFEARQSLARLMGQPEQADTLSVEPHLPDLPQGGEQSAPEALAEAMTSRRDLEAQQYELEALQAERGQQTLLIFDGTHLGYAYEREPSLESLQGFALSMPLPIFNQRQGEKARLDAEIDRQQARQELLSGEVTAQVKTLLVKMANARLKVEQLQKLVPLRREILELSRRQYNAMLMGPYQLLDTRGDSSLAVLTLADAKADYWRARTELERALGRSILKGSLPLAPRDIKEN
jgi:cobalt-zinc-cadmium efflux system outer membrane protein